MNSKRFKNEKPEINNDVQFLINIKQPDKKIVVSADDFNSFENKNSLKLNNSRRSQDNLVEKVNQPKIIDLNVENSIKTEDKISGDSPFNVIEAKRGDNIVVGRASSSVANKTPSVLVIQNLAGKKVTIIPKTTPVVLNSESVTPKQKNLIKQIPNVPVMNISDLNKSQQYFNKAQNGNVTIKKPVPPKQSLPTIKYNKKLQFVPHLQKIQNVELKEENKAKKSMPDFSRILKVLTQSEDKVSTVTQIERIPIYVDGQTQTDLKVMKDQAIQTEIVSTCPSPSPSIEELPNITNLLEYVLNIPKYSSGLDEEKKTDLIDMSKNIVLKGKMMNQQQPTSADQLKRQLFIDLKDCATFDFLGNKPIHNAVLENNLPLLKRQIFALRLRRIPLDVENNQGQTALQLAVLHNCNIDLIATVLISGVSTNLQDHEGNTLVHLAVMNSSPAVLELLLKHSPEPLKEINRKNDEGMTALMIAAIESKAEQVEMLLRWGADPNLRDEKSGRTALFHAVELNCNFVINLLLKHRADPKVRNYFGLTAIDAAKDLDIADARILEEDKDDRNPTAVIVNMVRAEKRGKESNSIEGKRARPNLPTEPKRGCSPHVYNRRKKP